MAVRVFVGRVWIVERLPWISMKDIVINGKCNETSERMKKEKGRESEK